MQNISLEEVESVYRSFDRDFKSVVLSTISEDGFPHASYAPILKKDDKFYFIISEMAEHYENILNNPVASLMFLEDELATTNVFFRKRLTYRMSLRFVEDEEVNISFIEEHGELVDMLINKMDFHIVEATPVIGRLVLGPGRTFIIEDGVVTKDKANGRGHVKNRDNR